MVLPFRIMQRVNEMAMVRQKSCEDLKEKMQQKAVSQALAGELWIKCVLFICSECEPPINRCFVPVEQLLWGVLAVAISLACYWLGVMLAPCLSLLRSLMSEFSKW